MERRLLDKEIGADKVHVDGDRQRRIACKAPLE